MLPSKDTRMIRAELERSIGFAKADTLMLNWINHPLLGDPSGIHEVINRRARLATLIAKHSHDGKMRVAESGRDCDGVQYAGHVRVIDATLQAYYRLMAERERWADGPFHLEIVPWDLPIEYRSRDLTLEAFEDGHAHCIHPTTL